MTKRATYLSKQDIAIIDRLNDLAKLCLMHDAEDRPKAEYVKEQLAELNEEKKIDATSNVAGMWEAYTKIVEETLDDKIENLENLKLAVTRDIPKPLMKQISEGKEIPHKEYKNATILVVIIGDVEGMTLPHKVQRATHIVTTLQKILESVVVNNKVYKVEQTGTKCVFASGIHGMEVGDPIAEVADAAIHMGSICGKGSLTDDADVEPKLKMAIHNGPVICGVTEGKVPKHVIYGTTLDFAYTMAISAPNNTIYVSDYVARHLQTLNRFNLKDEQTIQFEDCIEMVHTLKEYCTNEDFKVFNILPSSRSASSRSRRSAFSQLMTMEEVDVHNETCYMPI
ncbi:receptor-type guanylate cyclase gcy-27-like [Dysidea avara]|uniref:receptor-type guanylate cyclase gcy-27-like n=1 Tax=Dysidea avara TaxID=196820 RepID=UPI0033213E57